MVETEKAGNTFDYFELIIALQITRVGISLHACIHTN